MEMRDSASDQGHIARRILPDRVPDKFFPLPRRHVKQFILFMTMQRLRKRNIDLTTESLPRPMQNFQIRYGHIYLLSANKVCLYANIVFNSGLIP